MKTTKKLFKMADNEEMCWLIYFFSSYYVIYTVCGFPAFDFDSCIVHIPTSKLPLRFYDLEHSPDFDTSTVTTNPGPRNVQ